MRAGHDDDPAVQRRRLRIELRRLRQHANLTQRDVALAVDWPTSKVIRIEAGDEAISADDLAALLSHYGLVEQSRLNELFQMAHAARGGSWADFRDVHSGAFVSYLEFEASARILRFYATLLVPGILQTEDYAMAVLLRAGQASAPVNEPADRSVVETADRRWRVRQLRQEIHEQPEPPNMFFVLDEAVVWRRIGSAIVMRQQLERLKEYQRRSYVTIRIVPFAAGAYPGMARPFVILDFLSPTDNELLYLENADQRETHLRDDPDETGEYIDLFLRLEDFALDEEQSMNMLDDAIADLRRTD